MLRNMLRSAMLNLLLFHLATAAYPQDSPPLPLDPLTPQEREAARSLAIENVKIRAFLGTSRSREIYTDFIAVKRTAETDIYKDQPRRRHAEVLYYRYDNDLGVRALVDLEARTVVEVVRVNGTSVPINTEEIKEAADLALADTRVKQLFLGKMPEFHVATQPATAEDMSTNRIEGLRTVGVSPNDPCFRHRCIVLFFRTGNRYVQMNRVVVDLTSQRVQVMGGGR